MSEPRVAILGGGPAGIGAAWKLRRENKAGVILFEARDHLGGNSGGFQAAGQWLDYGSHRLHPACDAAILADVHTLLGSELLDRPRHGRIRLRGRWIHFPLKPVDLLVRLDKGFALGAFRDMLGKLVPGKSGEDDTFASALMARLGPTICESFYFPYALKLWGYPPEQLDGVQAKKRVAAAGFRKLVRKVLNSVPGLKAPGAGRFFYPREGYGQICRAYGAAAAELGADLRVGWRVTRLEGPAPDGQGPWRVTAAQEGGAGETFEVDHVWSTLPISILARAIRPEPPAAVLEAAGSIEYRSMILIYVHLPVAHFSEYDAHYFPGAETRISRMSEPKIYADLSEPAETTVLCAELPCNREDDVWSMSDDELGQLLAADLERDGIPLPAEPLAVFTRRLPQAYPTYSLGFEQPFRILDDWASGLTRLLSYGRQGLFTHDNTHHALAMAYAATECLDGLGFDAERWARQREVFDTFVVED